jgi:hypothetical protein
MKVVLSAETGPAGDAAREWCIANLGPADEVIAIVGLSNVNELVLGIPPFDGMATEGELLAVVEHDFCRRLQKAGIRCTARFRRETQARAVADAATDESADLIVIGKRPHSRLADAVLGPVAVHVVHHPPCPVVVVPAAA